MNFLFTAFLTIICLSALNNQGQEHQDKTTGIPVKSAQGNDLSYPWAGGMNSCQFGEVDLNMDGVEDLLVFDRAGDRLMPFINHGVAGETGYEYSPGYADIFPLISDWLILADYDRDGRQDIFTYSPGYAGMKVYRNISESAPKFELKVFPYLTSFQGGGYTNILVTNADYPGIADLDHDGDLDILTFWGLGSFVEMHRNLSYEKYGHLDSLDYEKVSLCWGSFAESEESNELTLDTCVVKGWHPGTWDAIPFPHTGSTFHIIDLNGDHVRDLLLGDVDYPNLVALFNDGSTDSAHIGLYDQSFPSYNKSIRLFSMPMSTCLDINNDGRDDLLVSPFDPNPFLSENKFSSWLYMNNGTPEIPYFTFNRADFLQNQMIDVGAGSYPVVADYDGDGLMDLFIGNYGYYDTSFYDQYMILHTKQTGQIALYRNTGSQSLPAFTFVTDDFAGLSALQMIGLMPAFADLDSDGDPDMLTGNEEGRVCLFENTAGNGQPMNLQLVSDHFGGIDAGSFSAVQLFDLDRDGTTDLLIGEQMGNLNYFRGNAGSPWMEFTLVTDSLGLINVTSPNFSLYGYSVPFFFRDMEGNTLLIVGSEQGELFFFNDIDNNLDGKFALSDTLDQLLGFTGWKHDRGYRTSAVLGDLNQDGFPDLLAGNFSGGVEFLSEATLPSVSETDENFFPHSLIRLYPNPSGNEVTIQLDPRAEMKISAIELFNTSGKLVYEESAIDAGQHVINPGNIAAGLYHLKIKLIAPNNYISTIYKKLMISK